MAVWALQSPSFTITGNSWRELWAVGANGLFLLDIDNVVHNGGVAVFLFWCGKKYLNTCYSMKVNFIGNNTEKSSGSNIRDFAQFSNENGTFIVWLMARRKCCDLFFLILLLLDGRLKFLNTPERLLLVSRITPKIDNVVHFALLFIVCLCIGRWNSQEQIFN